MKPPSNLPRPLRTFAWLLKREFWENKGGFFWAPTIAGIVVCTLALLAAIAGVVRVVRVEGHETFMKPAGEALAEHGEKLGVLADGSLLSGVGIVGLVLGFVVFFYCLGALFDDRRDRSILFWKSLPVSDLATVLSKLAWALVLAPALAVLIGIAIGAVLMCISAVSMTTMGGTAAGGWAMLVNSHPLRMVFSALSVIPVYACWALPTVGWLMLCSAFARSKPFLWAVLTPVLTATVLSWSAILPGISMPHGKIWYVLVYRGLLSVAPGTWYIDGSLLGRLAASAGSIENPEDVARLFDLTHVWRIFAGADIWIGMVLGVAMIAAAIWMRKRSGTI
jgi:ABC-2 type transport system permease protein